MNDNALESLGLEKRSKFFSITALEEFAAKILEATSQESLIKLVRELERMLGPIGDLVSGLKISISDLSKHIASVQKAEVKDKEKAKVQAEKDAAAKQRQQAALCGTRTRKPLRLQGRSWLS